MSAEYPSGPSTGQISSCVDIGLADVTETGQHVMGKDLPQPEGTKGFSLYHLALRIKVSISLSCCLSSLIHAMKVRQLLDMLEAEVHSFARTQSRVSSSTERSSVCRVKVAQSVRAEIMTKACASSSQ